MCAAVYRQRHLVRATKVNAGLTESNGRLLLGIWRDSLHVTCGLTACTPGSAPGPKLGNEYGKTLPLLFLSWPSTSGLIVPKRALGRAQTSSRHAHAVNRRHHSNLPKFIFPGI